MGKSLFKIYTDKRGKHLIVEFFGVPLKINRFCLYPIFGPLIDKILPKFKKKMVFFSIPDIADNPYYLYKYMKENHPGKFDYYWLTSNVIDDVSLKPANTYNLFSLKGLYHLYTAKYLISNHCDDFVDMVFSKRHVWLNLWHGMPVKTIGYCEKSVPKKIIKRYKKLAEMSYQFATSDIFKALVLCSFKSDYKKCLVTGSPRCDGIFETSNDIEIRKYFNFDNYKKVILYSPTYKQASRNKVRDVNSEFNNIFYMDDYNHEEFIKMLEDNQILFIVKPHPLDERFYKPFVDNMYSKTSNVKVLYNEDLLQAKIQLYEIFKFVDLMISDFSSIAIDYLILNRPVIYLNNLDDEYIENRGVVLEDNHKIFTPGAKASCWGELTAEINNALYNDIYKPKRESMLPLIHKYCDNKSSERIYQFITEL